MIFRLILRSQVFCSQNAKTLFVSSASIQTYGQYCELHIHIWMIDGNNRINAFLSFVFIVPPLFWNQSVSQLVIQSVVHNSTQICLTSTDNLHAAIILYCYCLYSEQLSVLFIYAFMNRCRCVCSLEHIINRKFMCIRVKIDCTE